MVTIKVQNISKSFGNTLVLNDISLEIPAGKIFFFIGPSGCGKTTLLRIIAGLEIPDSGKIFFDNQEVTTLAPSERGIGMVFQQYCLWPHMTVAKNISFGLEVQNLPKKIVQDKVNKILEVISMSHLSQRFPSQLSGGQQQRVALGRALILEPKVLLMDEPFSNLDPSLRTQIRGEVKDIISKYKITTVIVSHDPEDAKFLADEIKNFF